MSPPDPVTHRPQRRLHRLSPTVYSKAEYEFFFTICARHQGQPVVHDDTHQVWFFGEAAGTHSNALASLQAPDFTLPDLDGKLHSLSQYQGKKIFLVSWASW